MTEKFDIKVDVIRWACEQAGLTLDHLYEIAKPLKTIAEDQDAVFLTMNQIENIAKKVHIGSAWLFASAPPVIEEDDFPDFRTINNIQSKKVSLALKETIAQCKIQSSWYREYSVNQGFAPVKCVGLFDYIETDAKTACQIFKNEFNYSLNRPNKNNMYFLKLRKWIENLGVLVFRGTYSGTNSKATLNIEEFRGFSISDEYAPLIFINGNDSYSAQIFSLIHEFAHILINKSGISQNLTVDYDNHHKVERWCNGFAAEFLVPDAEFNAVLDRKNEIFKETERLSDIFKVSQLVILNKVYSLKLIDRINFISMFEKAKLYAVSQYKRSKDQEKSKNGNPSVIAVKKSFLSASFLQSVVSSVYSGTLRYTDAFKLLCIKNDFIFNKLANDLY